jgi:hypothetical protein
VNSTTWESRLAFTTCRCLLIVGIRFHQCLDLSDERSKFSLRVTTLFISRPHHQTFSQQDRQHKRRVVLRFACKQGLIDSVKHRTILMAVGCVLGEGFEASSMISISHQFESHPLSYPFHKRLSLEGILVKSEPFRRQRVTFLHFHVILNFL